MLRIIPLQVVGKHLQTFCKPENENAWGAQLLNPPRSQAWTELDAAARKARSAGGAERWVPWFWGLQGPAAPNASCPPSALAPKTPPEWAFPPLQRATLARGGIIPPPDDLYPLASAPRGPRFRGISYRNIHKMTFSKSWGGEIGKGRRHEKASPSQRFGR